MLFDNPDFGVASIANTPEEKMLVETAKSICAFLKRLFLLINPQTNGNHQNK